MAIVFQCKKCGKRFELDDSLAGKRGRCKDCGLVFQIPGNGQESARSSSGGTQQGRARDSEGKISFACHQCGQEFSVAAALAGKKVRCKQCASVLVIPESLPPLPEPPPFASPAPFALADPYDFDSLPSAASKPLPSAELGEELLPPQADWKKRTKPKKKRSKSDRSSFEGPATWMYLLAIAGVMGLMLLVLSNQGGFASSATLIAMIVGLALLLIGNIWACVLPFRESVACGLMYLFVPFYAIFYIITRWDGMRHAFLTSFCGWCIIMSMSIFSPAIEAAREAARKAVQQQQQQEQQNAQQGPGQMFPGPVNPAPQFRRMPFGPQQEQQNAQQGPGQMFPGPVNPAPQFRRMPFGPPQVQPPVPNQAAEPAPADGRQRFMAKAKERELDDRAALGGEAGVDQLIEDIQSPTARVKKRALARLAKALPNDRREEVAKLVEPLLKESDQWIRRDAARVLIHWGGKENVPALLEALKDSQFLVRGPVLEALASLNDPASVDGLVECLLENRNHHEVGEILKAIGPPAEEPVLKCLQSPEFQVRRTAYDILSAVGGSKSVPLLRRIASGNNGLDTLPAQLALEAIRKRGGRK